MTQALSPADREAQVRAWWERRRLEARQDVNAFIELSFKNDQSPTNEPMRQQWFHREWQTAWCNESMVVIHGATGIGKTDQSIGHLLWRIGRKPSIRILIVSNSQSKGLELSSKLKRQIDENEIARAIFPELRAGSPWGVETFRVAGAGIDTTTNTVTVYGIDKPKPGPRADIVLIDDPNDEENTRSDERRKNLIRMVDSVLQTRLTTNGQLFILANAWHPEDLAFTYSKRPGIWYRAYPAWDVNERLLWPEFRTRAWLEAKRGTMGATEFARMFLCQPRDESTRIFKAEWFALARKRGAGLKPVRQVRHSIGRDGRLFDPSRAAMLFAAMRDEMRVIVGSDLATGESERKRKTDFSVNFTLGVHPNGDRQLLWIEKGRWGLEEKLIRYRDHERRYQPVLFVVEDNGMQKDIVQYLQHDREFGARVVPFTTTGQKWHTSNGIEGIGLEMSAGRWIIPGPAEGESEQAYLSRLDPEEREAYALINAWCQHQLDFSRGVHTDDDVAAGYFAKEGALRMVTGTFSHDKAGEMAAPPPEQAQGQQIGNWGTIAAAFPPAPPAPPPAAAALPEAIRRLYGRLGDTLDPLLASFLRGADRLPSTLRYQRLDTLERYYEGRQYEDRELDAAGYRKGTPGMYGSMSRTPAWCERDPGAVWSLTQEAVHEITDWSVGGDSWCHLEVADDDAAEDWIDTVAQQANMGDVVAQSRNWGGATGTAIVSFAVREGEFFLEAHDPKLCWPLAWRDARRHRPSAVALVYQGDNPLATKGDELPLLCRYWDEQVEAVYQRERNSYDEWVWREVESVAHGLGFCPVYWHPQLARGGSHEGTPDGGDTFDEIDEVNELVSAAGCTTKRNADDTLVIKEDPTLNPGNVRKGGFNTIFARGGAEYLSQTGESAKVCIELAEKHEKHIDRRFGVAKVDAETLGAATTGEAMKKLFQRTLKTSGRIRRDYARGLIVPLCQGMLEAARALTARGLVLAVPPRVVESEALEVKTVEPRTPGKSSFVQCVWPDAFQPTMADLSALISAAVNAAGGAGKQVMSLETILAWLKGSPLPISSVEDELERIQGEQEAAAERSATALGLGQEPPGAAGPVGGKEPVEEDPEEASKDNGAKGDEE